MHLMGRPRIEGVRRTRRQRASLTRENAIHMDRRQLAAAHVDLAPDANVGDVRMVRSATTRPLAERGTTRISPPG